MKRVYEVEIRTRLDVSGVDEGAEQMDRAFDRSMQRMLKDFEKYRKDLERMNETSNGRMSGSNDRAAERQKRQEEKNFQYLQRLRENSHRMEERDSQNRRRQEERDAKDIERIHQQKQRAREQEAAAARRLEDRNFQYLQRLRANSRAMEERDAKAKQRQEEGNFQYLQRLRENSRKMEEQDHQERLRQYREIGQGVAVVGYALTRGLTDPIISTAKAAADSAMAYDSLRRGLMAVEGSSEKTTARLEKLREAAKLPGLGFREAIEGQVRLSNTQMSADLATRSLVAFGNALALVGKGKTELDGINLALTQIAAKQKISAEEINQIAERVPQIRKIMEQAYGTANTELLQQRNVKPLEFIERIVTELEKLPKFTSGIRNDLENFSDVVDITLAKIGDAILPFVSMVLKVLSPAVEGIGDAFASLSGPIQVIILAFAAVLAAIGPVTIAFGALIYTIGFIKTNIETFKAGMELTTTVLQLMRSKAIIPAMESLILLGKAMIGQAIIAESTAATIAVATAGWAALIGVLALVIYIGYKVYESQKQGIKIGEDEIRSIDVRIQRYKDQIKTLESLSGVQKMNAEQEAQLNAIRNSAPNPGEREKAHLMTIQELIDKRKELIHLEELARAGQLAGIVEKIKQANAERVEAEKQAASARDRARTEKPGVRGAGGLPLGGVLMPFIRIYEDQAAVTQKVGKGAQVARDEMERLDKALIEQGRLLTIMKPQYGDTVEGLLNAAKAGGQNEEAIQQMKDALDAYERSQKNATASTTSATEAIKLQTDAINALKLAKSDLTIDPKGVEELGRQLQERADQFRLRNQGQVPNYRIFAEQERAGIEQLTKLAEKRAIAEGKSGAEAQKRVKEILEAQNADVVQATQSLEINDKVLRSYQKLEKDAIKAPRKIKSEFEQLTERLRELNKDIESFRQTTSPEFKLRIQVEEAERFRQDLERVVSLRRELDQPLGPLPQDAKAAKELIIDLERQNDIREALLDITNEQQKATDELTIAEKALGIAVVDAATRARLEYAKLIRDRRNDEQQLTADIAGELRTRAEMERNLARDIIVSQAQVFRSRMQEEAKSREDLLQAVAKFQQELGEDFNGNAILKAAQEIAQREPPVIAKLTATNTLLDKIEKNTRATQAAAAQPSGATSRPSDRFTDAYQRQSYGAANEREISRLKAEFQPYVREALGRMLKEGIRANIVDGARSAEEQFNLYNRPNRNTPFNGVPLGQTAMIRGRRVVGTGTSQHQDAGAVDFGNLGARGKQILAEIGSMFEGVDIGKPYRRPNGSVAREDWHLQLVRAAQTTAEKTTQIAQSAPASSQGPAKSYLDNIPNADRAAVMEQLTKALGAFNVGGIDQLTPEQVLAAAQRFTQAGNTERDLKNQRAQRDLDKWNLPALENERKRLEDESLARKTQVDDIIELDEAERHLAETRDKGSDRFLSQMNDIQKARIADREETQKQINQLNEEAEHYIGTAQHIQDIRDKAEVARRQSHRSTFEQIVQTEEEFNHISEGQADRYKLAWVEANLEIAKSAEQANIRSIKAMAQIADMGNVHAEEVNARFLEFLASQKSATDIVSDAQIGTLQKIYDVADRGISRFTSKLGALGDIVHGLISGFAKLALNNFFLAMTGQGTTGGGGGGTGSGGGIGGFFGRLLGGGGGGGGTPPFVASGGGGTAAQGGIVNRFLSAIGLGGGRSGGGAASSMSGSYVDPVAFGAEFGAAPTLSAQVANQLSTAAVIGGTAGKTAGSTAAGAAATAGRFGNMANSIGAMMPLLGLSMGVGLGGPSRVGSVLGGAGGLLAGGIGGALVSSLATGTTLFGSTGALHAMTFGAIGGPIGLAIGAAIAGALLVGGLLFGRNAQRRRDEESRTASIVQAMENLRKIVKEVDRGRMDPDDALDAAATIRANYLTEVGQLKDKKTRQIAQKDVYRLDVIIDRELKPAIQRARERRVVRENLVPEYAFGGPVLPDPKRMKESSRWIKVKAGERVLPYKEQLRLAQFGGIISGVDNGRDDTYMQAPIGSIILNREQQRVDEYEDGGVLTRATKSPVITRGGGAATTGDSPIILRLSLPAPVLNIGPKEAAQIGLLQAQTLDGRRVIVSIVDDENERRKGR